ncbi:LOW QUALITY PROTEIN: hypothetical protein TorRG33x02_273830 [Trema orientale]|uniref:Uncharacterized protein n=1 Tax=Trema orientale TaxID=63057 RepID=A0A2P5CT34_TREOI|nr:LOW QUALITY PROTEIN: hypothetical protein TorRG33x02_273830 [Trema orientale]
MTLGNAGGPPPPPPVGATKSLRPKKVYTKLERSTIVNLYRTLKGKMEGTSNPDGKSSNRKKSSIGGGAIGVKQGMADALAEMTKSQHTFNKLKKMFKSMQNPSWR